MKSSKEERSPQFSIITTALRNQQMSKRTENKYLYWINKFIYFHKGRHPKTMQEAQVQDFLLHLALRQQVSISTQNVALKAVLFMFQHAFNRPLSESKISLHG